MKTLTKIIRFLKNKVLSLFTLFAATLLLFVAVPLKSQTKIVGGESATYHPLGAILLSEAEYNSLPTANWAVLRANAPRQSILKSTDSSVMLECPPVGNQGSQGSCVAWAVGYAAASILAYPKYENWDQARRSPSFLYNQIKAGVSCSAGASTTTALNKIKNDGVSSWLMMPYIDSDCSTQPNANQKFDATLNNITSWWALEKNNVDGIKEAIKLGYPVVVAFPVYTTSFDYMWKYNGGIWDTNNTSGTLRGGHACCIVGYDDTRQMFKVQNSWGASGGDNGFFWVTYDLVRNRIFNECYVVYGMNPTSLKGGKTVICGQSYTYTIMNLPSGTSVAWSVTSNNLIRTSYTSNSATFLADGAGYCDVVATLTKNGATVDLKVNNIRASYRSLVKPKLSSPSDPWIYFPTSPSVIEFSGTLVMEDMYGRVNGDSLEITNIVKDRRILTTDKPQVIVVGTSNSRRTVNVSGPVAEFSIMRSTACGRSTVVTYRLQRNNSFPWPSITIYPNPATDYVTLTVENTDDSQALLKSVSDKDEKYEIRLVNLQGRMVKSMKTSDISSKEISLQDLQPGMYYIHIVKDGEVIQREKIMKK